MTKIETSLKRIYIKFAIEEDFELFIKKNKIPQKRNYIQAKTKLSKCLECVFYDYGIKYHGISLKNFLLTFNIKNKMIHKGQHNLPAPISLSTPKK